jgi:peptide/nickel transport system ATP-binding protein
MYAGRIVEELRAADLSQARHPYTRGLLECLPALGRAQPRLKVMVRDPTWAAA